MYFLNRIKKPSVIPGFKLTMGFTLFYLSIIVLVPLSGLFFKSAGMSFESFIDAAFSERVVAAYKLSFYTAFFAALFNVFFGLILCWVLVRYNIPGKAIIDAIVDLPFALPTAVAGIALTSLYASNGLFGGFLNELGIKAAFTPLGIMIALIFVGIPFVVRTVEPVLMDLDKEIEEAAASLGANRLQIFTKVIFPNITPALLTGFAMAFAKGIGEYGSVIFIAGNMPMVSEIAPLLIVIKLEQYDYAGATAIAIIMLLASFILLYLINLLEKWSRKRNYA